LRTKRSPQKQGEGDSAEAGGVGKIRKKGESWKFFDFQITDRIKVSSTGNRGKMGGIGPGG